MSVQEKNKRVENLQDLLDDELIRLSQQGHSYALELLIQRYRSFVLSKARTYFLVGGDKEDVTQEGMIGLYNAICDYDQNKITSFRAFADLCITRQIITAIKAATRQKHTPLNTYTSLNKPIYDEDSDRMLIDLIEESRVSDPQELIIYEENLKRLKSKLSQALSDFEYKVLNLYLDGYTYQEISDKLNRHVKSIDNALQRIKRKFEQFNGMKELSIS